MAKISLRLTRECHRICSLACQGPGCKAFPWQHPWLPWTPWGHLSWCGKQAYHSHQPKTGSICPLLCTEYGRHSPSQSPCLIPEQGLKKPDYPLGRFLQVQQRGAGGAAGGQDRGTGGPSGERGEVSLAQLCGRSLMGSGSHIAERFAFRFVSLPIFISLHVRKAEQVQPCSHFHFAGEKTQTHPSKFSGKVVWPNIGTAGLKLKTSRSQSMPFPLSLLLFSMSPQ